MICIIGMYCPSVQSKLKNSRYQCQLPTCMKVFTTLELAKRHAMLLGHSNLSMSTPSDEPIAPLDDNDDADDQAPVVSVADFIRLPFVEAEDEGSCP